MYSNGPDDMHIDAVMENMISNEIGMTEFVAKKEIS